MSKPNNFKIISKCVFALLALFLFNTSAFSQKVLMTTNSFSSSFRTWETTEENKEKPEFSLNLPSIDDLKPSYQIGNSTNSSVMDIPLSIGNGTGDLRLEGSKTVNYFRFMNQKVEATQHYDLSGVLQRNEFTIKLGN